jgi:hypothetical protein
VKALAFKMNVTAVMSSCIGILRTDNKGESAVHNRCVKPSVMYISLVYEREVQFNTRDFYCGNVHKEEIVWKV